MNWPLLLNSLLVSGLTTMLAGGVGFIAALALYVASDRCRQWLVMAAIVALVLPPFMVVNTWLDLLATNGALQRWLSLNLYSLGGAVWLLSLLTWPVTTLLVLGAWSRLERAQLESDAALCSTALVRWLLWPMARTAVGQAAVLTFVLALNNFAIPVILQVPVFPEELWLAFTTRLNEAGAWVAAWPLVAAPAIALLALRQAEISWPRPEGAAATPAVRRQLGSWWRWGSSLTTAVLIALSVALPMAQLVSSSRTWSELLGLFRAAPEVIWNSLFYAGMAATVCVATGLLSWRLPIRFMLWLPFLIPGILLGRALVFAFSGTVIYGTAVIVLLAFALRYLAIGWTGVAFAMRSVDSDLNDAGRLNGAGTWTLLRHVQWPQIAPQAAASWYLTYLLCLWDVETLVLIYPPGGETLALRIFNFLHYGHHAQVNALCIALLLIALVPLAGWCAWRVFRNIL
jgi:ABC-type Fe3+ transport system permease subunit